MDKTTETQVSGRLTFLSNFDIIIIDYKAKSMMLYEGR